MTYLCTAETHDCSAFTHSVPLRQLTRNTDIVFRDEETPLTVISDAVDKVRGPLHEVVHQVLLEHFEVLRVGELRNEGVVDLVLAVVLGVLLIVVGAAGLDANRSSGNELVDVVFIAPLAAVMPAP